MSGLAFGNPGCLAAKEFKFDANSRTDTEKGRGLPLTFIGPKPKPKSSKRAAGPVNCKGMNCIGVVCGRNYYAGVALKIFMQMLSILALGTCTTFICLLFALCKTAQNHHYYVVFDFIVPLNAMTQPMSMLKRQCGHNGL